MTRLLEKAIGAIRDLPSPEQDEIARAMLEYAKLMGDEAPEDIDPADMAAVLEGLADVKAGRIATEEEIKAAYRRFGK